MTLPIYVKPFVKPQKNDAAAIAEAALRSNPHCAPIKSAEHQGRAFAFRTHQCVAGQRTQLINALRGHLAEFGVIIAQGTGNVKSVSSLLSNEKITLPKLKRILLACISARPKTSQPGSTR